MNILRQYLFLIPVVVMLLCELTKAVVENVRTGQWHLALFRAGGMPSTHSAFVTSMLIIVERKTGVESVAFAIAFSVAAIVWYDAFNVRREVGLQAEVLNRLQKWKHFTEHVGHSFVEVLGGIVFGTVVTYVGIWLS
jgi:uncharacterized protein